MNLKQLRDSVRSSLRDDTGLASDAYWSDTDLNEYLNEGYSIFCRSTQIIRDSVTAAICTLTVNQGDQNIAISPLILKIERAKPTWYTGFLTKKDVSDFDNDNPSWFGTAGTPRFYALDYSTNYLTLDKAASVSGTIALTVKRMPLSDLSANSDYPEFNSQYHWMLKDYALYRAFMKQDAEVYNPQKAATHRALFMGNDDASPGGHILAVKAEIDPLPQTRKANYF